MSAAIEAAPLSGAAVGSHAGFLVLRQDPDSRAYRRMGRLVQDARGYVFEYDIPQAAADAASPLPGFPDWERTYVSSSLFATFSNRVMTPRRDNYGDYLGLLGLDAAQATPFEVLARTWGARATDRIQLLPIPSVDDGGRLQTRFLVHGGGHVDPSGNALRTVRVGDVLQLRAEPSNAVDPRAVLVLSGRDEAGPVGYVPAPLAPFIHSLWEVQASPMVMAEVVNLPGTRLASNQMRLLVRLEAHVRPDFSVETALALK